MSRYYLLLVLLTILSFTGCGKKAPEPTFNRENEFIFNAYDGLNTKNYKKAYNSFEELYKQTKYKPYFLEALKALYLDKNYNLLSNKASNFLKKDNSKTARRYYILALKQQKKMDSAIKEAKLLIDKNASSLDYTLIAELYGTKGDYNNSLKYYQSAYAIKKDEFTLDKIASIIFSYHKKKKEAIAYYETHIRMFGCGKMLCHKLAKIYAIQNNIDGILSTYKRLYEEQKNELVGKKVIDLFLLKKQYKKLKEFLNSSRLDDKMLLDLYKYEKDYKNASAIALRIYNTSNDINYLAEHAMLNFEAGNENDIKNVNKTIEILKKVIKKTNNHIVYNFLGYLMIDNEIDIKNGIKYVKVALKQNEDNLSYIDSLAWGMYKLKKYKKAYELIKKVKNSIIDDKIVDKHYKLIEKKYKKRYKKRKR